MLEALSGWGQAGSVESTAILFLLGILAGLPSLWGRTAFWLTIEPHEEAADLRFLRALLVGLAAAATGAFGGMSGGATLLLVWLAIRHGPIGHPLTGQAGFTLIEVLAALAILSAVLLPMLDFGFALRSETPFLTEIATKVAVNWIEERHQVIREEGLPDEGQTVLPNKVVGKYTFRPTVVISKYPPAGSSDYPDEEESLRLAEVTVTCLAGCPRPIRPVRVVAVLGQR